MDPPRKGCEESLLAMMCEMAPQRIVYVSCDSATLARDLKYLCSHGYDLVEVQPVDQFGHTVHVETVVLMSKNKIKCQKVAYFRAFSEVWIRSQTSEKARFSYMETYLLQNVCQVVTSD